MGEIINLNERLVNYCRNVEDSRALSLKKFTLNLRHGQACKRAEMVASAIKNNLLGEK